MKFVIVFFACLVASAYSRQIVIKYVQQPESDGASTVEVHKPKDKSFLGEVVSGVGDLAAETADTVGRVAQGIVEVPATLISKTVEEAGKGAAKALRETGNVAANAIDHVEHGINNMFSGWDK